eukprot:scaffold3005_cov109-Isochrysis_galbana.AAC.3
MPPAIAPRASSLLRRLLPVLAIQSAASWSSGRRTLRCAQGCDSCCSVVGRKQLAREPRCRQPRTRAEVCIYAAHHM